MISSFLYLNIYSLIDLSFTVLYHTVFNYYAVTCFSIWQGQFLLNTLLCHSFLTFFFLFFQSNFKSIYTYVQSQIFIGTALNIQINLEIIGTFVRCRVSLVRNTVLPFHLFGSFLVFLGSILKLSLHRCLLSFLVVTKDLHISVACDNKGLFLNHVTCACVHQQHLSSLGTRLKDTLLS